MEIAGGILHLNYAGLTDGDMPHEGHKDRVEYVYLKRNLLTKVVNHFINASGLSYTCTLTVFTCSFRYQNIMAYMFTL